MPKEIQLTQGQVAIVDDWWFDELNQYNWQAVWNLGTKSYYARRNSLDHKTIIMHRVIAGAKRGEVCDHSNHNTLDNREENLRVCTSSQNNMNRGKKLGTSSEYKGVTPHGSGWRARIKISRMNHYLGTYKNPEDAAKAYDEAAKRLHGEFATLNFGSK